MKGSGRLFPQGCLEARRLGKRSHYAARVGEVGLEFMSRHLVGAEPKALRPRTRVSFFTRPACERELRMRATMSKAIINIHFPSNYPFSSRLDRTVLPRK